MSSYFLGKKPSGKGADQPATGQEAAQGPDHTQVLHPQPIPGVRMCPPEVAPLPGQVVIGYRVIDPKSGKKMAAGVVGGTALGVFSLLIFPCCLPCAVAACVVPAFQGRLYQVPVYGWPGEAPAVTQMTAAPEAGQPVAAEAAATDMAVAPAVPAPSSVAVAPPATVATTQTIV